MDPSTRKRHACCFSDTCCMWDPNCTIDGDNTCEDDDGGRKKVGSWWIRSARVIDAAIALHQLPYCTSHTLQGAADQRLRSVALRSLKPRARSSTPKVLDTDVSSPLFSAIKNNAKRNVIMIPQKNKTPTCCARYSFKRS